VTKRERSRCRIGHRQGQFLNSIAQRLRLHTAAAHSRVEDGLALLDPAVTPARLRAVLERFHGFWNATEPVLDRWAATSPAAAHALDWPRRRRTDSLAADLHRLGATAADVATVPVAAPVFAQAGTAEALGWLYVSEGSALGGVLISRHLRTCESLVDVVPPALLTFAPYPSGPAPMWRSYLAYVQEFAAQEDGAAAVLAAATATFDALADWLAPLTVRAAA
jgi:heme oxygenase (biliverdin-IX-beta and delta-forming)